MRLCWVSFFHIVGAGNEVRTHDLRLGKATHYRCATPAGKVMLP